MGPPQGPADRFPELSTVPNKQSSPRAVKTKLTAEQLTLNCSEVRIHGQLGTKNLLRQLSVASRRPLREKPVNSRVETNNRD